MTKSERKKWNKEINKLQSRSDKTLKILEKINYQLDTLVDSLCNDMFGAYALIDDILDAEVTKN